MPQSRTVKSPSATERWLDRQRKKLDLPYPFVPNQPQSMDSTRAAFRFDDARWRGVTDEDCYPPMVSGSLLINRLDVLDIQRRERAH